MGTKKKKIEGTEDAIVYYKMGHHQVSAGTSDYRLGPAEYCQALPGKKQIQICRIASCLLVQVLDKTEPIN